MSPYTVATRRSGASAGSGYQSTSAARAAAQANIELMNIMRSSAASRALAKALGGDLDGGPQPEGAPGGEGSKRKSPIPDSPGKFKPVKLPKLAPLIGKVGRWQGGPSQGLSLLVELYQMYMGHRDSGAATRPYGAYGGWSFQTQCTPPPGYNTVCDIVQPSPGVCLSLQAATSGHGCGDVNSVGGVGSPLASSTWIQTMGGDGGVGAARRYATLEIYRRNPVGSTQGGPYKFQVQPHPARPAKLPIFGPMPEAVPARKGANRARPERKWFPEIEAPGRWAPQPMPAPWVWLRHREQVNPMRATSEQSMRGYGAPGRARARPSATATPAVKTMPGVAVTGELSLPGGHRIIVGVSGSPTRTAPPKGAKEKKLSVKGTRAILAAVNLLTEGFDYLDAFYDALPKNCKRTKSQKGLRQMRPQHKLAAVAACWEHLSWKDVIKNLIENEVEDRVFGGIGQKIAKGINRDMGRPVGVQTGAGAPGKVPKGTQMGAKPWDNWTDSIWP